MAQIEVKSHIDPTNDSVELVFDLVGTDPFQHEFLKQVFKNDLVSTEDEIDPETNQPAVPHGKPIGEEDLRVRIPTKTAGAFQAAKNVIEDRRRASLGLPSLKEEADAKAAQDKAAKDAEAAGKVQADLDAKAKAAGYPNAAAQREAEQRRADLVAQGEAIGRGIVNAQAEAAKK